MGRCELNASALQLSDLRMSVGKQMYVGSGSIGGRQPMLLDVAANGKLSRLVASAKPEDTAEVP